MIKVRLQIADGEIFDTYDKWGLIYVSSDNRTEAPIKSRESTQYAEEPGEHIDNRTLPDAFDYKVNFVIEAENKDTTNANAKIAEFNKALYATSGYVRKYQQVTFYNDYKRVKIVGLPSPISEPKDFYRRANGDALDCVQVEFTIRVSNPTLCDFDLKTEQQ